VQVNDARALHNAQGEPRDALRLHLGRYERINAGNIMPGERGGHDSALSALRSCNRK
jgi:hypothetical protein